jgi:hypothetical protein
MSDLEPRKQTDRRLRFISDLVLPPSASPVLGLFAAPEDEDKDEFAPVNLPSAEKQQAAAVLEDSLVSFTAGLSDQNRDDVTQSLLFMQLGANHKYSRMEEREQWYKFYYDGLSKLGWLTTDSAYQSYSPAKQSFTMDEVALEIIAAVGGQSFALLASAATKALQKSGGPLKLFENSNKSEDMSSFKMLPCIQTQRGDVSMMLNFMRFTKTVKTTHVLFWKFSSSDVRIYRDACKIQLIAETYKDLRKGIQGRLGKKSKDFIAGLEI